MIAIGTSERRGTRHDGTVAADPADGSVGPAMVVWSGYGSTPMPARDEGRVVDVFGPKRSTELMPLVLGLYDDFYDTDAALTEATLVAVGEKASADFKRRHPEIPDEAVEALVWCYTFDFK